MYRCACVGGCPWRIKVRETPVGTLIELYRENGRSMSSEVFLLPPGLRIEGRADGYVVDSGAVDVHDYTVSSGGVVLPEGSGGER